MNALLEPAIRYKPKSAARFSKPSTGTVRSMLTSQVDHKGSPEETKNSSTGFPLTLSERYTGSHLIVKTPLRQNTTQSRTATTINQLSRPRTISAQKTVPSASLSTKVNVPTRQFSTNLQGEEPQLDELEDSIKVSPELPLYSYKNFSPKPSIQYIRHAEKANEALALLKGPLGLDMEWRVIFRPQRIAKPVAVIQVCDRNRILIIQTSAMQKEFPSKLKEIIEDPSVVKTGVNIRGDAQKLFKDYNIRAQNLVELSWMSRQADPFLRSGGKRDARTLISLSNLCATYLSRKLVKSEVRLGNWEAFLNETQLEYAANDTHCSLNLYLHFLDLAKQNSQSLRPQLYTLRLSEDGSVNSLLEAKTNEPALGLVAAQGSPENTGELPNSVAQPSQAETTKNEGNRNTETADSNASKSGLGFQLELKKSATPTLSSQTPSPYGVAIFSEWKQRREFHSRTMAYALELEE